MENGKGIKKVESRKEMAVECDKKGNRRKEGNWRKEGNRRKEGNGRKKGNRRKKVTEHA
jgi:hypothetical protein